MLRVDRTFDKTEGLLMHDRQMGDRDIPDKVDVIYVVILTLFLH